MLWLALSFPQLPLEVFTSIVSDRTQPVIVLEDNRIAFLNDAAHAAQLSVGTSLATAHTIVPNILHFHRDTHDESQRLNVLADALYRFSDHVCLQLPDCIVLEIGGSLKLFGSHERLVDAAVDVCSDLGHSARGRCAATPWAAIALARSGAPDLSNVPLNLAGLELANVPHQIIERFANMGIYTLGPLLDLPSTELGKRFGPALLLYLEQLVGNVGDPRDPIVPAPEFCRQVHLLQPISDKEDLFASPYSPMQKLSRELQHWLISHQLGCERLEWQFGTAKAEFSNRSSALTDAQQNIVCMPVRFARGKQNQQDFLRISELKLEFVGLPQEVMSVSLAARHLSPWHNNSQSLFAAAGDQPTTDERNKRRDRKQFNKLDGRAAELVDELTARLGDSACRGVQEMIQHTPESAWMQIAAHQLTQSTPSASSSIGFAKRPLWLLNPPRRTEPEELSLLQGPERIQTQWWTTTTSRDYYIARHVSGAECWAFVDECSRWYLHGYFA